MSRKNISINPVLHNAREADWQFTFDVKKAALGAYIEQTWGWDDQQQVEIHSEEFDTNTIKLISIGNDQVGYLETLQKQEALFVRSLYILPQYQCKGIGFQVLSLVIEEAASQNLCVCLGVLKVNSRAKNFYERSGFIVESETETHYLMKRSS